MVQFVRLFGQRLPKPEYDLAVASLAGVIKETHVFELLIMLSISSSVITPVFLDYAAFYVRLLPTCRYRIGPKTEARAIRAMPLMRSLLRSASE